MKIRISTGMCSWLLFCLLAWPTSDLLAGNFPKDALEALNKRIHRPQTLKVSMDSGAVAGTLYVSPYGMVSEWPSSKRNVTTRSVKNRDYAFQVKRKDGVYHLCGVRRPSEPPTNFEKLMQADMELAFPETNSFGIPILDFDNSKNFEKVSESQVDGKLNLALRCKIDGHEFLKKDGIYTLVLDPKREYCLCRAELEHADCKTKILVDYVTQEPFGQVPSRLQIHSEYPGNPPSNQDYKIATPEQASIDPAEFRLPFYGISESSVGISASWSRLLTISVSLASASALVALLFWRNVRR